MTKLTLSLLVILLSLLFSQPVSAATLSLLTDSPASKIGETITLNLHLDPQGQAIIGTDIDLNYDPTYLDILHVSSTHAFNQFPALDIDSHRLRFALVNNFDQYLTAPQVIAVIEAKPKKSGHTSLTFNHSPGSTTDSNVIITGGTDTLTSAPSFALDIFPSQSPMITQTIIEISPTLIPTLTPAVLGSTSTSSTPPPSTPNLATGNSSMTTNPAFTSPLSPANPSLTEIIPTPMPTTPISSSSFPPHLLIYLAVAIIVSLSLFCLYLYYQITSLKKMNHSYRSEF